MSDAVSNLTEAEAFIRCVEQLGSALEQQLTLVDSRMVDPLDRFLGPDGELWDPITGSLAGTIGDRVPYSTEEELANVRGIGRYLWRENGFAQNGHENRISYVVGSGHIYTVVEKPRADVSADVKQKVQEIVDEFLDLSDWDARQEENVLRRDRDGECILRKFPDEDEGVLTVRFVEPESLFTPQEKSQTKSIRFGVESDPEDRETVVRYWIDGEPVDAADIQHRKRCVDSSCPRGVPIFWSVRHNLSRANKILRNGSTVTELQTAIGMIRKLVNATNSTVNAFVSSNANVKQTSNTPGFGTANTNAQLHQRFRPGSIVTTGGNVDYSFPGMGIDPSKYVESLQAEIRAVAARLIMTEAMFSSKTDDTSRAAAVVAEGPVSKNFERLQQKEIRPDLRLIHEALDVAVTAGRLTEDERNAITVTARGPRIIDRDRLTEAQAREIDIRAEILSPQTAAAESGRDYEQEQSNIEDHRERSGGVPTKARPDDFLKGGENDED